MVSYDFDNPINHADEDVEEDCDLPKEIARLLKQESKVIWTHEELVEVVNLGTEEEAKEVRVGSTLQEDVKAKMVKLLQDYMDVFAWSYQDIPGLDIDIMVHHLSLKEDCPPVKQNLRRTRSDMAMKIKEEVQKQFNAVFQAVSSYPKWIANLVPIPKKDNKVRMCIDY